MNKGKGPSSPQGKGDKRATSDPEELKRLIAFHGHLCPGLLIGYRATRLALRRLRVKAAQDEELIAIVENNSCSADAVQFLASCTFGKGNLFYRPFGKQVFTFARRPSGEAVRVSLRKEAEEGLPSSRAARRRHFSRRLLSAPDGQLFRSRRLTIRLPAPAQVFPSLPCQSCGEPVMEIAA
ncbi:MAG: FmdE family protein, partial [candidate division NC10 bacterium]|nr:FmdE family protein [candidate division NC10 bacterium]